jgi:hypothetical protein
MKRTMVTNAAAEEQATRNYQTRLATQIFDRDFSFGISITSESDRLIDAWVKLGIPRKQAIKNLGDLLCEFEQVFADAGKSIEQEAIRLQNAMQHCDGIAF